MSDRLKDKVAIVTGASSGIGRAIALEFVNQGAKVVGIDRNSVGLEETAQTVASDGNEITVIPADLTKIADIDMLVQATVDKYSRIDVLFSCHGVIDWANFLETSEELFDRQTQVNFKTHFFLGQRVARVMKEQGEGKIAFISSPVGAECKVPTVAAYGGAKAGLTAMAMVMSVELAPYNINVNVLMPGNTRTAANVEILKDPDYVKAMEAITPLGRLGETSDLTPAAIFMTSSDADYMTGHILYVDGGIHKTVTAPTPVE